MPRARSHSMALLALTACAPSPPPSSLDAAFADVAAVDQGRSEVAPTAAPDAVAVSDTPSFADAPHDAGVPMAWLRLLDASFLVTPSAIAVAPDGTTCVVGDFQGDLRCMGRSISSSGASDGFVACFAGDGALLALIATGAPGDDGLDAAAWDGDALVVAGHLPRAATLGGISLGNAGGVDVLVARMDRTWRFTHAVQLGGAGTDQPAAIAVAQGGLVHLAGASDQGLRHGALTLGTDGRSHAWTLTLDRTLAALGGRSFAAGLDAQITALRVGTDGALTVGGQFSGSLQTGGAPLGPTLAQDVFVLRLSPEGRTLWAQQYGGSADDRLHDLAVGAGGEVTLAGSSGIGRVALGETSFAVEGASDGWLARVDPAGAPRWLRRIGGEANDRALSIWVDGGGGEVAGRFDRTITLGPESLTSLGESDGWRARFDAAGTLSALTRYGGPGPDLVARVAEAPGGSVSVGTFAARVEIAGETLQTAGISGAFVHRAVAQLRP